MPTLYSSSRPLQKVNRLGGYVCADRRAVDARHREALTFRSLCELMFTLSIESIVK